MNASQNYWSRGPGFRLQLRDSWNEMILDWKGLYRTFNPIPFSAQASLVMALK